MAEFPPTPLVAAEQENTHCFKDEAVRRGYNAHGLLQLIDYAADYSTTEEIGRNSTENAAQNGGLDTLRRRVVGAYGASDEAPLGGGTGPISTACMEPGAGSGSGQTAG